MVRKFVFVPGEDPRISQVGVVPVQRHSKAIQWLLLGLALTVSAIGFSLAKSTATEVSRASSP